jgi:hypothetical protein
MSRRWAHFAQRWHGPAWFVSSVQIKAALLANAKLPFPVSKTHFGGNGAMLSSKTKCDLRIDVLSFIHQSCHPCGFVDK